MAVMATCCRHAVPAFIPFLLLTGCFLSVEGGMNATWIHPTVGCFGFGTPCFPFCEGAQHETCPGQPTQDDVCEDIYLKANLGQRLMFSLAATNPTPSWVIEATPHCNRRLLPAMDTCAPTEITVSPMLPLDTGKACCGASENFAMSKTIRPDLSTSEPGFMVMNPFPEYLNVTHVTLDWNITDVEDAGVDPIPLYNISFMAAYGGLNNVSACTKTMFVRICSAPIYDISPKASAMPLAGSPAAGMMMSDVDCDDMVCLDTPGMQNDMGATHVDLKMGDSDVLAGMPITFNISARTVNEGNTVELLVTEDPGLPIGMTVSEQFVCGSQQVCRTISWTPGPNQVGTHMAYFVARSFGPGDPAQAACGEVYSAPLVVRATVRAPQAMWVMPAEHVEEEIVVGTTYSAMLTCQSNYEPRVQLAGGMESMGAEFELVGVEDTDDGMHLATYRFQYLPQRGEEGATKSWSFTCGDNQGIMTTAPRTITLSTRLCIYTVQEHDTLQTITRRYHLSTNWLNVWNANPTMVLDPDLDIGAGKLIKVGPVYEVKAGDTLANVAGQFSTTVKKLLSVNPHLLAAPEAEIEAGEEMCILACTNQPAPSMSYKWAY